VPKDAASTTASVAKEQELFLLSAGTTSGARYPVVEPLDPLVEPVVQERRRVVCASKDDEQRYFR
jgi:hypothetical protein